MSNVSRMLALGGILLLVAVATGCSQRDPAGLPAARATIDPLVFDDAYGGDVYFQAFMGTDPYVVGTDSVFVHSGKYAMTITVPPKGSNLGAYAGGVLTTVTGRDEAGFNALTFWARSSVASSFNTVGFGNDNTGTSRFEAGRSAIPLAAGTWTQVIIPIPSPGRLINERGMFTFAEDQEAAHPEGHTVWFDDIRYAKLDGITNPRPTMSGRKQYFVGAAVNLTGTSTTFSVDGTNVTVTHMPGYFAFQSSDPSVAVVDGGGVRMVGIGSATLTATLDRTPVTGTVTVQGYEAPAAPAPRPTLPAADVISLFSDAYPAGVTVTSWNPHWNLSTTEDADYLLAGDHTKMYSFLNFVGIDFTAHPVDATAMTAFHVDVYAPQGTNFKVKLVAFNATGLLTGQSELTFDATTSLAFAAGGWSSLEIPLSMFGFTVPLDHVGQLVLSTGDAQLVLVDNIYWHK